MIHRRSTRELNVLLTSFKQLQNDYNSIYNSNKEVTYKFIKENEINHVLKSDIPNQEKKKILLAEIGAARINIFGILAKQIQHLEQDDQLDNCVEIMNEYVNNVASIFIAEESPSLIENIKHLIFSDKNKTPLEYLEDWKKLYEEWNNYQENEITSLNNKQELYTELQTAYKTLYSLSFSKKNFPNMPNIVYYNF